MQARSNAMLHLSAFRYHTLASIPFRFVDCVHIFSVLHLITLYQEGARVNRSCITRCHPSCQSFDRRLSNGLPAIAASRPAWNWRMSLANEQVGLALGAFDALAGDVEILGFWLYPDEVAAHLDGGNASGAGAHEGV